MRFKALHSLVIVFCGVVTLSNTRAADCCRKLGERVYYGGLGSHRIYEDDSTLERLDIVDGRLSITLTVYQPPAAFFRGPTTSLVSTDLGHTWEESSYPWGLPSDLPGKGDYVIQAPSNPNIIYKWLQEVGLYLRSEDRGATWRLPHHSVDGVSREDFALRISGEKSYRLDLRLAAIHPIQPLTLYAAIAAVPWAGSIYGEGQPKEHRLPGIYVSHDGGESWTKFTDALQSFIRASYYDVSPLGISPSAPQVMYGNGNAGILKSVDGGKGWALTNEQTELRRAPARLVDGRKVGPIPTDPGGIRAVQFVVDPTDDRVVYVVSNRGVYRTGDGGDSWCLLNLGFDVLDAYNSMGVNPVNPKEIFISTVFGLYYSKDRGCHFQRIYPAKAGTR